MNLSRYFYLQTTWLALFLGMWLPSPNASALDLTAYTPLTVGSQWTYINGSNTTQTQTVGSPVVLSTGASVTPVTSVNANSSAYSVAYMTVDGSGIRRHQDTQSDGTDSVTYTFLPALYVAPTNVTVGDTYTSTGTLSVTISGTTIPMSYSASTQIAGFETVTNYSGTQSWSALKMVASVTASGVIAGQDFSQTTGSTVWMVEGIGPVQIYQPNLSWVMETWKLSSYSIGRSSGTTPMVVTGRGHTVTLKSDGTVATWGYNSCGQLGDGTTTDRLSPVAVPGLTGVVAVSVGDFHSMALKSDGTMVAWGCNFYGQLGDGTTTDRLTPVAVSGLSGGVAVAAGYAHSLAVKSDGTVVAWGYNADGQLGDGTTTNRLSPVAVPGLTGVVAVEAGQRHTVALKSSGTMAAWGYNFYGQLGDGTTTNRLSPVAVPGLTGVEALEVGGYHTVALKSDGTVAAWGFNADGELGDGTTTDRSSPVAVPGLTAVANVVAGAYHTVALKSDGTVMAWGYNNKGQLGDGTTTNRLSPVAVSGLTGVASVSAGSRHTAALMSDGRVVTWGENIYGQLGDGTVTNSATPVIVPALSAAPQNYTDSWYNANESGWGLTITDHDTNAFVQWYTYDQTGHNQKYVISGGTFSNGKCLFSGDIKRITGPSWNLPTFDPNQVTRTTVGSGTIDFCPAGLADGTIVFGYTAEGVTGSKQLTRLSFGNDVPHWGGTANTGSSDFSDLWWNSSESGWGVSVTQHGNNLFFRIFTYDTDNRPLLFIVPGVTFNSSTSFTGNLVLTSGPWYGTEPFDPNQVTRTTAGTATLTFSDANNGVLSYTVNGVTVMKTITRLVF